ncbi:MAG: hypothetical protein V4484_16040 [Pseudomonadota bacterium]
MKSLVALIVLMMSSAPVFPQTHGAAYMDVQNTAYVEVSGIVQDGRTSLPIEGASVLATWVATTNGLHTSTPHCLRIAGAQTDAQGRFSISAPASDIFRRGQVQPHVEVHIYKNGFIEHDGEPARTMSHTDTTGLSLAALSQGAMLTRRHLSLGMRLFPYQLDAHERLRYLGRISQPPTDCATHGAPRETFNYFDAIANEANRLAHTQYEQALAAIITERGRNAGGSSVLARDAEAKVMNAYYAASEELDDLNRRDRQDRTPLMRAANAGDAALVTELLRKGANPNRTRPESFSDSALTIAMENYGLQKIYRDVRAEKYLAVIATLLNNSTIDPNLRDDKVHPTPLMKARSRGQDVVVDLLLRAGAMAGTPMNAQIHPNLAKYDLP